MCIKRGKKGKEEGGRERKEEKRENGKTFKFFVCLFSPLFRRKEINETNETKILTIKP